MKWVARNIVWLLSLLALIIFRAAVAEWIIDYAEPITSTVEADQWSVLTALCCAVGLCYVAAYKRLRTQHELLIERYNRLVFLFVGYLIIRLSPELYVYGMDGWGCYTDYAWVCVALIELYLYGKRRAWQKERQKKSQNKETEPFFTDAPTDKDEMEREQYATQLIAKIHAGSDSDGAFAVLLNEHFGNGKTSFMLQLEQKAKEKGIDVCWFKPWLYDNTKVLLENYMRILQEVLGDNDYVLRKMLDRYVKVLSPIDRFKIANYVTYDDISTETQLSEIKETLKQKQHPIIMMIDDIDRLQSDELLRMLQLVRNIADFPYVYYIIAGDKEALQNRLEEKEVQEPDEYLKKFFNFEICFPADDTQLMTILKKGLNEVMGRYGHEANELIRFIEQMRYGSAIFANIRDVKRFLNVLDYTLTNFQAHGILEDVYMRDVAGIGMIQCLDSEFYKILRDHNEYILKYAYGNLVVKDDFTNLLANRENVEDKPNLKERIETIYDLVRWSKPTKMEIIGELLGVLFPRNTAAPSKTCVCHPTEYFKYFSTTYKGTEMSNAEAIGVMQTRGANFQGMARQIIHDGRIEAFRHKMAWYLQTQKYNRLEALGLILDAFEIEWEGDKHKDDDYKTELFKARYGASMLALFHSRSFETSGKARSEWNRILAWLISTSQYARRILVLSMLKSDIPNHDAYIFENPQSIRDGILASERQFVNNVWSRDKYNKDIYQYAKQYMKIDSTISEYVAEKVNSMKRREPFFYHLVEPTADGLRWNEDFISSVIGSSRIFDFTDNIWSMQVPDKWIKEFLRFDMKQKIKNEDINRSDFLKNALKYWKNKQKSMNG